MTAPLPDRDLPPEFEDQLRGLLETLHPEPSRRRARLTVRARPALAAALLVALAVAMITTLGGDRATSALAVERAGDVIEIRLDDATAGRRRLTAELRAAGVKAEVFVAPATPDAVGTWVDVSAPRVHDSDQAHSQANTYDEAAEREREAERLREIEIVRDVVRIPVDYPHHLMLVAGVAATAGRRPLYDANGHLRLPRCKADRRAPTRAVCP